MKINWRQFISFSFWFELFCFVFSLYLALSLALHLALKPNIDSAMVQAQSLPVWQFIIGFLAISFVIYILIKYWKNPWLIKVLFYAAIIEGLWLFGQAYYEWPYYLFFILAALFLWAAYRNVLIHDLVIMIAISAISIIFGLSIKPSSGILILLFIAVYDYWAVYKTTHMVQMFKGLAESKVYFTIIIPQTAKGLFKKMDQVNPGVDFMFLGTGDIALPAIFVVSCLHINLLTALITALGSVSGFIFLYVIFVTQKEKQPMPGLPPIVLGTLLGFLLAILL